MVNTSELATKLYNGETVDIGFLYPTESTFDTINSFLAKVLARVDRMFLLDTIITVVREIVLNAVKANVKRVFFKKLNLDIYNRDEYEKGMEKFKDVVSDLEFMKNELTGTEYRVVFKAKITDKGLAIQLTNNSKILPEEAERIRARINNAARSQNFAEAYEKSYDPTEGAGIGIILIILLLRNAGIGSDSFKFFASNNSVTTQVLIPDQLREPDIVSAIKNGILDEVNALPTFPKNIMELQAMCNDSKTTINAISEKISHDPSLTADVLKLANSAGFITAKRIESISEAVITIGLKNLDLILKAAAMRKILDKRYKKFEQIWDHCNKTAYFARNLAIEMGRPDISHNVFIAGLLHDIGKIVLLSTDLNLVNQISMMVDNRKIRTSTILEEIYIGISHSTIGAMIADKWNFPADLIDAIRNHHSPLNAEPAHVDIVMIVYLANIFSKINGSDINLYFIESDVLERYNINAPAMVDSLYSSMNTRFETHRSSLRE